MSLKLADALVFLGTEDSGLKKGFDSAKEQTKTWAGGMGTIVQGALIGVGQAITSGIIGLGKQAMGAAGDSIKNASDMNETVSKVNTLFGNASPDIQKWSEGSAKAMGLSKTAALDAVGSIGNMFMQLGAGKEDAAKAGEGMTQLSADIASFHNVAGGTPEVLEAIQAGFRGEYDSLQRFIPTISAATVEQEALSETHKTSAKDLTALEKAYAVQAIVMRDAGAATGDFARTSGGLANQQRISEAQMTNLSATIGKSLLPVVTSLQTGFNTLLNGAMPGITSFIDEHVAPTMVTLGEKIGNITTLLGNGDFAGAWGVVTELFGNIIKYVEENLPTWIAKVGEWGAAAWQWIVDVTPTVLTKLGDWAGALWGWVTDNAPSWGTKLGEFASNTWRWLVDDVIPAVSQKLGDWGGALWGWVKDNAPTWAIKLGAFATSSWNWLTNDVIPVVATKLNEWGSALWSWVANNAPAWATKLSEFGTNTWTWLANDVIPAVGTKLGGWITALGNWALDNAPAWASKLGEFAFKSWDWLTGTVIPAVATKLGEWGTAIFNWVLDNAGTWGDKLNIWAGKSWDWLANEVIPKVAERLGEWGTALWQWIADNAPTWGTKLAQFGLKAWNWLTGTDGVVSKVVTKLGEWATALYSWATDPANLSAWGTKLKGWGTAIWDWLTGSDGAVSKVGDKLGEWSKKLYQWAVDNLPVWIAKFEAWSKAAWQWIIDSKDKLGEKLGIWWTALKAWLDEKLPVFQKQMEGWAATLGDWVKDGTPKATNQLGDWWVAVSSFFVEKIPDFAVGLVQWTTKLVEWIGKAIPDALDAIGDFTGKLVTWITSPHKGKGQVTEGLKTWIDAFVDWVSGPNGLITRLIPEWEKLGGAVIDAIVNIATAITGAKDRITTQFGAVLAFVGEAIVNGIKSGIDSASGGLLTKMSDLATQALNAAKTTLGIQSPSKRAGKEVGIPFAQGIGVGFESAMPSLIAKIRGQMDVLMNGAGNVMSSLSNVTNNNISLNLQGSGYAPTDALAAVQLLNMHYRNA